MAVRIRPPFWSALEYPLGCYSVGLSLQLLRLYQRTFQVEHDCPNHCMPPLFGLMASLRLSKLQRSKRSLDYFRQGRVNVNRLGDGVSAETHAHSIDHFLEQYGGVGADYVTTQDFSARWIGQHLHKPVPVLDGGAVSGVLVVVGGSGVVDVNSLACCSLRPTPAT